MDEMQIIQLVPNKWVAECLIITITGVRPGMICCSEEHKTKLSVATDTFASKLDTLRGK